MNAKRLGLAYAMMALASEDYAHTATGYNRETSDRGLQGAPPQNPKKVIPKGCQEFDINGEKIIALSYKRALTKYNKRNT